MNRNRKIKFNCIKCGVECSISYKNFTVELCKKCKTIETNLKKYGVENPFQSKEIKEKIKLTNLKKYGGHHAKNCKSNFSREEVQDKIKKTKLHRYGDENYNNIEKIKQTKVDKYGDKNYNNVDKAQKTMVKKYGAKTTLESDILRKKVEKTKLKRYNDKNYNNIEKSRITSKEKYQHFPKNSFGSENFKNSMLDKYGVKHNMELEETKKKIKNTNRIKFFNLLLNSDRLKNLVRPLFSEIDYIDNNHIYEWKCCRCENNFFDKICDGLIPRCPVCFPKIGSSKLEKEIANWLKSLNIEIIENTKSIISPWELDIYIPSYNLALEFNGLYWHSELQGKNKDYHLNKTNMCQEKGIQLLHIWENEWIEKQDIVKSIIKSKLGLYDSIIHGRKCSVKQISNKEASDFYFENHIQGNINSSINLGLYYDNELVSCLSFSKPRFNKKYDWEITRFANKLNYKIHGGFGKLWKHRPEGSIITYSDKRLFTGEVYKKYMTQLSDSKPSYWYFKDLKLHSRLEFQKHKLSRLEIYDSNFSEWENMQLNGYDRIWDCGNHVFRFFKIVDVSLSVKS